MGDDVYRMTQEPDTDIRRLVHRRFGAIRSFAALAPERRDTIVHGVERLLVIATRRRAPSLDRAALLGELLDATFEAIVDASVKQMEAYAELLENAGSNTGAFFDDPSVGAAAGHRQQLLASMVLMGIKRVQLSARKVHVLAIFDGSEEDEDERR